jgi:hypothetical protein
MSMNLNREGCKARSSNVEPRQRLSEDKLLLTPNRCETLYLPLLAAAAMLLDLAAYCNNRETEKQ